ncbi:hypothetical protein [Gimesia aquarii]|uniref:Uncharacterized protein n=1 Tax=Gimesia aquarii TaxID=2527964 RepID=A0A517W3S1_9PLAN|nr:hypothetical protein [Gimesia aquarii]QDT99911.1 hypothetical protein V144x_54250 [Gimesia aquarii]
MRETLMQRKVWLPIAILFLAMAISGYRHCVLIWCNSQFEIWCSSEKGVVGFRVFVPYHGQRAEGFYFETALTNHMYLSSNIPAWFRGNWGRPAGVFRFATSYGGNIPYWFLMLAYFVFMHFLRKRQTAATENYEKD